MNGGGQLVDRREQVDRRAGAGPQVQVKLIDGLKVGDLEEERAAVGQDVGRADRQRVVAGLARVARRELGRAVARPVAIVPRLGEMAVGVLGDALDRAAART